MYVLSLPTRGAWIEISPSQKLKDFIGSLPTRGAWIEIIEGNNHCEKYKSRSPHGERGLKYVLLFH